MSSSSFFDDQHSSDQLPLPLWFRALRRWEVTRVDVAAALLPASASLLDVGCGAGELVTRVGDKFDKIVATDVSGAAIEQARERVRKTSFAASIELRVLDANLPLPFESEAFETLVSLSTLQYIFDPELFLKEAWRVLTPGGTLLVEVPNVAYLPQRLRLLAGLPIRTSYWKHGIDGGNLHYFTLKSLLGLLGKTGFRALRHTGSGVLAGLRSFRPSLLCGNLFVLAQRTSAPPGPPR